ncbi:MAG TPA: hypothetical protein VKB34_01510 [Povalibacter sp.]|nr:hypothetical protein [Povalibacter sp.]
MTLGRALHVATIATALLILGGIPAHTSAADEPAAASFVTLKFQGACDAQNNRLWLTSTHTFKTIAVTVRWRAAGGKDLMEQFFTAPSSTREIGCAAEAEITSVAFADF